MTWHGERQYEYIQTSKDNLDLMEELAADSKYWRNALSFVLSIQGRSTGSLTENQLNWWYQINASIDQEQNKRISGELFNE